MITFRYVRWKNLLSTGNYFTEIKLNNNTNTLVVGENGSGKSTMLDALCFGLFGKAFRNVNKPNLLNSINGKDCVVEVEFDNNNKSYKIIRGIKPNVFEIYCDGELLNQDAAARDYQEYLEKFILKLNYKSFTQIVILGSASFVPFMQLSASDRRAIIEDLLDIQIFSAMNGLLKDRLTNNKDLMTQSKNEIELTQQRYDLQDKHIKGLKQNNEEKVNEYVGEIQLNKNTIQTLHDEIANLSIQVSTHQDMVAEKTLVEDKVKKITKLESVKLLTEQTKLNEITEIQKRIQTLQIDIATKNTSITETSKYITRLEKQIEELKTNKASTEQEEQELELLKTTLSESKSSLKSLIDEKTYYEVASGLLKDTGIKTKIIKQYLPIINKLVNKYLASLDFFVNFNLDESFKETIKSRHRDDFTYNNFSEGEKQRIDMALMLTWRAVAKLKNSSNTNLLILDEVFDSSLDTNGTEELMKILHMLEGVNLFVISHKGDILVDKFANVVRFEKVNNFSRIMK